MEPKTVLSVLRICWELVGSPKRSRRAERFNPTENSSCLGRLLQSTNVYAVATTKMSRTHKVFAFFILQQLEYTKVDLLPLDILLEKDILFT